MTAGAVTWRRDGAVYWLQLGDGENRLDRESLNALDEVAQAIETASGSRALVTSGQGRHFSNGYDLAWLSRQSRDERRAFIRDHQALLARFLLLPCPTIAVLSGHAIGAGALLALTHDVRLMSDSEGWFCLPEIDARIPFRRGMSALLRARLSDHALRHSVLTGARLDARTALRFGIVDEVASRGTLLTRARELASERAGTAGDHCGVLKSRLLGSVARLLRGEVLRGGQANTGA